MGLHNWEKYYKLGDLLYRYPFYQDLGTVEKAIRANFPDRPDISLKEGIALLTAKNKDVSAGSGEFFLAEICEMCESQPATLREAHKAHLCDDCLKTYEQS